MFYTNETYKIINNVTFIFQYLLQAGNWWLHYCITNFLIVTIPRYIHTSIHLHLIITIYYFNHLQDKIYILYILVSFLIHCHSQYSDNYVRYD